MTSKKAVIRAENRNQDNKRHDGLDRDHHIRRLTAIQFIKERVVEGKNNREIARSHNVSSETVRRTLTWAEKAKIFVEIEDQLLQDIAPMAVSALKDTLAQTDDLETRFKAVQAVLNGLNFLKKSHPITAKEVKEQDDLVSYITSARHLAELEANTVPGELVSADRNILALTGDIDDREPLQLASGLRPERSEVDSGFPPTAEADGDQDPERVCEGDGADFEAGTSPEGQGSDENSPQSVEEAKPLSVTKSVTENTLPRLIDPICERSDTK